MYTWCYISPMNCHIYGSVIDALLIPDFMYIYEYDSLLVDVRFQFICTYIDIQTLCLKAVSFYL